MHTIHLTAPVDMGNSFGLLPAGDWIVQDQNAFEIALMADRGTAKLSVFPSYTRENCNNVLIMRSGAIGDLLFMSPAIRAFKRCYPKIDVSLCCFDKHFPIFENTDLFHDLIKYPMVKNRIVDFDRCISLENVIELSDLHATDAFGKALFDPKIEDYKPVYKVSDQEKTDALAWKKKFGSRPLVGIQLKSSTRNRDYPLNLWAEVIICLEKRGWAVILFGQPGQIPPIPTELNRPFVHDASQSGMSLRESVALLWVCDAFVGVDSSFIHFCHALDIPAVGLFGPFKWQTRTSKAPLTRALTGTGDCAGCGWHSKIGRHFPSNKPCSEKQKCLVLADIKPERIIAAVEKLKP
jgi:ADP-heptose:LPS heptosyltransferase